MTSKASKLPSAPSPAEVMEALCVCGHKNGLHWHRVMGAVECGECGCRRFALPEPVSAEGATAKSKCVDCRDYETNIRKWIAQLGGTPDVQHISLELERLIDGVAAAIAPAAAPETEKVYQDYIGALKLAYPENPLALNVAKEVHDILAKPSAERDGTHTKNVESELAIARDLIARLEARIAELTGCNFSDRMWAALKARAEAAEANLRAVSDALEEIAKLDYAQAATSGAAHTAVMIAKRAILEGK